MFKLKLKLLNYFKIYKHCFLTTDNKTVTISAQIGGMQMNGVSFHFSIDFSVPLHLIKRGTLKTSPLWGCLLLNSIFGFCFCLFLFSIANCKVMVIFSQKTIIFNENHGLR
jgi:hypothetical protein